MSFRFKKGFIATGILQSAIGQDRDEKKEEKPIFFCPVLLLVREYLNPRRFLFRIHSPLSSLPAPRIHHIRCFTMFDLMLSLIDGEFTLHSDSAVAFDRDEA